MAEGVGPQHGRGGSGRPAWVMPVAIAATVVVAAGITVGVVLSQQGDSTAAPTAPAPVVTTVVLPVPTPSIAPSPRASTTTFSALLPDAVLQYALTTEAPATDWQAAGALEAWTDTYSDGGAGTLTVQAGQWPTGDAATAYAATLVGQLPTVAPAPAPSAGPTLPQTGAVTAGGAPTGTYTIVDAGDGTGVAVWTNGTAVFRLVAPLADILNAYAAYPL